MTNYETDWNGELAAHLARRAGFGATPRELEELVASGRKGAIERLVKFPVENVELDREMQEVGGTLTDFGDRIGADLTPVGVNARSWWLYRMVRESHPLREKLTLFWHDHFACQRSKILRLPQYFGQNAVFRKHACGSFREMLIAVAHDGGMLAYLDNRLSDARNPNENWARELLELFTLGVDSGYEQRDVYELARVFTGWTTPDLNSAKFLYDPALHDSGDKILFGERIEGREGEAGMREGYEALERILAKPECADFLAKKLIAWFGQVNPELAQVQQIGEVLRRSDYSIRAALLALFDADWFYAPDSRSTRFKNPVELVASAAHLLEVQNPHLADLEQHARTLGMELFEPPSVAGWDLGSAWVNSGSTVGRAHFALRMSSLASSSLAITGTAAFDLDAIAGTAKSDSQLVSTVARRLLQADLPEQKVIEDYLAQFSTPAGWPADHVRREKTRAVIHLVLLSPRFALA